MAIAGMDGNNARHISPDIGEDRSDKERIGIMITDRGVA